MKLNRFIAHPSIITVFQIDAEMVLKGLTIIFVCLWLGEGLSLYLDLPIPGNVIGMVLLTTALQLGLVKLETVQSVADGLLQHIALFFVPPGVGLMMYFDIIRQEWIVIIIANIVSTFAVLIVVGLLQQSLEKRETIQ